MPFKIKNNALLLLIGILPMGAAIGVITIYDKFSVPSIEDAFNLCSEFIVYPADEIDYQGHFQYSDVKAILFSYSADPLAMKDIDKFADAVIRSAIDQQWKLVERKKNVLLFCQTSDSGIVSRAVKVGLRSDLNQVLIGDVAICASSNTSAEGRWVTNSFWPRFDQTLKQM